MEAAGRARREFFVLAVFSGDDVSSANLAGNQAPMGGAIYAKGGRVNLSGLEISGNSTSNGNGAGLVADNVTKATITQTYFHDNNATNNGGAIYGTNRSSVIMTAGTFAHDIAQGDGGIFLTGAAIATDNHSQLAVVNSTFLGDSPEQNSESILISKGIGRIVNSTFDEATLTVGSNATLSLRNSILAGVHCDGPTYRGLNIQFGDVAGCQNIPLADPALDPDGLQFNGGLTPTIAILRGSHAIDAIPIGKCTDQNGNRLKTDQRGFMRPAPQHKSCDIGAFEFNG